MDEEEYMGIVGEVFEVPYVYSDRDSWLKRLILRFLYWLGWRSND